MKSGKKRHHPGLYLCIHRNIIYRHPDNGTGNVHRPMNPQRATHRGTHPLQNTSCPTGAFCRKNKPIAWFIFYNKEDIRIKQNN